MDTEEATKILEKEGYKVYSDGAPDRDEKPLWGGNSRRSDQRKKELKAAQQKGKVLFRLWRDSSFYGIYTGRELVDFARKCHIGGSCKKDLKKETKSERRARDKTALNKLDFDKIPLDKEPKANDISLYY